jgi:hypothetical protein
MTNDDLAAENESQTFVTVALGIIDGESGLGRIAVPATTCRSARRGAAHPRPAAAPAGARRD